MKIKLDENFDRRLAPLLENPFRFPPEDTEGIIVVRPPRAVLPAIRATLLSILPQLRSQSLKGALWIVEPGRIRVHDPHDSP